MKMDEIKSAWELALERTKDIETDHRALKEKEFETSGKKIASRFLDDPEKCDLKKEIAGAPTEARALVTQGCIRTLVSNLTLPLTDAAKERNKRVRDALLILTGGDKTLTDLFGQLEGFFENYAGERERMQAALEQQYEPRLRQKEAALAKQFGTAVRLQPAQDPEFVQLLKKQLGMFDGRYQEVLSQAKAEIGRITGVAE
jgi:hypothetical protein